MLKDRCHINTNYEKDTFVGLQCVNGELQINFPIGFPVPVGEEEKVRKDILLLLTVLANNTDKRESAYPLRENAEQSVSMPLFAYIYVIKDYLARGYYHNYKVEYVNSKRGKINWHRTIKIQKPLVQDTDIIYLEFATKKTLINDNDIITLIHQYCVYKSFVVLGWLFTEYKPPKPILPFNKKWFVAKLKEKLATTFVDENKKLFQMLLKIVQEEADTGVESQNFHYGTNRFEYVWESMIDKVFGRNDKKDYFPKTEWFIHESPVPGSDKNGYLQPDTIMEYKGNIYVLDGKYYKYGESGNSGDLPGTSSINKQITYGEYIANNVELRKRHGVDMKVYNAFIMPFDANKKGSVENKKFIGTAVGKWKDHTKEYEHIQGILLDVKHLMNLTHANNVQEISEMAEIIKEHCETKQKGFG